MKYKGVSRRDFMKMVVACYTMTPYASVADYGKDINNIISRVSIIDSDYVIINGWVLLKSDIAMDDGI